MAKVAEKEANKAIRNARERELHARQKVESATTKARNLQTQVAELAATLETERRDAAREVEVVAEQLSETEKKLRRTREQLGASICDGFSDFQYVVGGIDSSS